MVLLPVLYRSRSHAFRAIDEDFRGFRESPFEVGDDRRIRIAVAEIASIVVVFLPSEAAAVNDPAKTALPSRQSAIRTRGFEALGSTVVPDRAQHHAVIRFPVDRRVVPDDELGASEPRHLLVVVPAVGQGAQVANDRVAAGISSSLTRSIGGLSSTTS